MAERFVVVGMGYCGERIAAHWRERGGVVWGTTRSVESAVQLEERGIRGVVATFPGPPEPPRIAPPCPTRAAITFGTSGPPESAPTAAVDWLAEQGATRVVYLSSTSVYGDQQGGWVNADTPAAPDTAMGRRRVVAEQAFLESCARRGVAGMTLRLPGIYGPGRTIRARLEVGDYVYPVGNQRWSNRVHVDDIATAVATLAERGGAGEHYLASDGEPFTALELIEWASAELGSPAARGVPFDELSERAKPFWKGSRRCDAGKLRALGWTPRFSDFRAGHLDAWRREDALGG